MKFFPIFFLLFFSIFAVPLRSYNLSDKDWAVEYNRLENRVSKNFDEPENLKDFELFIRWMGIKAKDRDEVKALLEEVNRLSYINPDDKDLEQWTQKFFNLQGQAQASGISTVNGACMMFMRLRSPQFPKIANWEEIIWRLQKYGRVIYTKAQETDFVSPKIKGYAKCLINFSIRDVEGDPYGFGVYRDREGLFGNMDEEGVINIPDRDFDTDCERRGEFTLTSKGEPAQSTDIGLDWIEKVREEAKWWQLAGEYSDATDLMNEFFEDSMCKSPPNTPGQGHKNFYGKQALKHRLQKSIDYNEGFYGIVYGKVEIETSEGRTPAGYATVKVTDPYDGKTWETEADSEGNYEIKDVILHKDCSPFTITAASGIDKVIDQYDGPLEKPDQSYRYEKNLVIRKSDLLCHISVNMTWTLARYDDDDGHKYWEESGSSRATITGSMKFKTGGWYDPEALNISYRYRNRYFDYRCEKDCPKLKAERSGEGFVSVPKDGVICSLNPLANYYHFALVGISETIRRKYSEGYSTPDCLEYKEEHQDIDFGFGLLVKEGKNGEMSGSRSWMSGMGDTNIIHNMIFEIEEFHGENKYDPPKSSPDREASIQINVKWSFEKLKK